ncbi:MAG: hypothetical protein ACLGI6_21785, partial [Gammaproteobacteria bacterium]
MTPDRTLHIFYRHVHIKADKTSRDPNKARPEWFSHELCFRNLLQTIAADPLGERVRLTVVYDGSLEDFTADFIARYYAAAPERINVQFIKGGSDLNSFLITLHVARTADIAPTDIVYFLENDYLHQPGWISKVFELYASGHAFDVLGLYDHADKYFLEMYRGLSAQVVHSASHHWRTAPSTCASFMLERQKLERDYAVLSSGQTDYYFFTRLIAEGGRVLLTPLPGLSTHSMNGYLSPTVDWASLAA